MRVLQVFKHRSAFSASQTRRYGQVRSPSATSTTFFPTTRAVHLELTTSVLPKFSNSKFGLTFWNSFSHHDAVDVKKSKKRLA